MNPVEPIPFEPTRFFVASDSRKGMRHVVDLAYDAEQRKPGAKCQPFCGCEDCMTRPDRICKHIVKVVKWILKRKI
jgi:hypothetical protein